MPDFVREANIPNLLRCARNTEEAKDFNLADFIFSSPCGSFGCLIGNDRLAVERSVRHFDGRHVAWSEDEYNLPAQHGSAWYFLFSERNWHRVYEDGRSLLLKTDRPMLDRDAALRRLRKFIYYVLHKREMLYDERGCVRETARRQEGDHFICRAALEQAEAVTA